MSRSEGAIGSDLNLDSGNLTEAMHQVDTMLEPSRCRLPIGFSVHVADTIAKTHRYDSTVTGSDAAKH